MQKFSVKQESSVWAQTLWAQLSPYRDKRVLSVFVLGIAQGLPWVMIGSMLTLWLKSAGVGRAEIGYATLIFAAYTLNFLWSPIVDVSKIPLFKTLSQRQSWVVFCQLIIIVCCATLYVLNPDSQAKLIVLVALGLAFFSATQDIAIDAYRVDSFADDEGEKISAAAGLITAGWWTGYAALGFIPLYLSENAWSWQELYLLLGGITAVICVICALLPAPKYANETKPNNEFAFYHSLTTSLPAAKKWLTVIILLFPILVAVFVVAGSPGLPRTLTQHSAYIPGIIIGAFCLCVAIAYFLSTLLREFRGETFYAPYATPPAKQSLNVILAWTLTAIVAPLREFFTRNGVKFSIMLLCFIFLFKLGEAFLGKMSIVFYKEVGFSNTEIGFYSKLLTWWVTIIFAVMAGLINAKLGLIKGLFISGCAMAATNLMFSLIAVVGPNIKLYAATIVLDGFAAAWSTVAFVSFISLMCNHAFSATQYALLASLSNLGKTILSSVSGQVVDWLNGNWAIFFVITTLMVIPSLMLLLKMREDIQIIEDRANK